TAGAVKVVGSASVVLGAFEVRKNVVVAPPVVAKRAPVVVVVAVTAHVDHVVDRARAPEHLAARPVHLPPLDAPLRRREVRPVVSRTPEEADEPRRVNPQRSVRT